MINKIESAIKDKIESASLEDLIPDFDQEATWAEINTKLYQKPRKKKMVWLYMPYAAAIVLGILLCYFLNQSNEKTKFQQSVTQLKSQLKQKAFSTQQVNKADTATAIVQNLKAGKIKQAKLPATLKNESIVNNAPLQQPSIAEQAASVNSDQAVPIAIVKPVLVKHFLDIDNEDQSIMKAEQHILPRLSYKTQIVKRMSKNQPIDQNALPLRELYYAISN
jgi:hypothetical protein